MSFSSPERRNSSIASGKTSRACSRPSQEDQTPSSSSSATSTPENERPRSSFVTVADLFKAARNTKLYLKIKQRDHELDYILHMEGLDGEYGVHEKILAPRKDNSRLRITAMGSEFSKKRRQRIREARSRSPASDTSDQPRPEKHTFDLSDEEQEEGNYTVSKIKTAKLTDEGPKFLVQWLNYPGEDTWESFDNCRDCEAMDKFEKWWPTIGEDDADEVMSAFQLFFKRNLESEKTCDMAILLRMSETKLKDLKRDKTELEAQKHELVKKIRRIYSPLINYNDYDYEGGSKIKKSTLVTLATKRLGVQRLDEIMDLKEKRVAALQKMTEVKNEINESIRIMKDGPPVEIENLVDAEVFKPFTYVKEYQLVDVPYDDQLCITCNCVDRCSSDSCPCLNEHPRAYDEFKNLKLPPGKPIYECNPRCACGITCKMRVISDGRKHRLCIFKTDNGRGWGLKTLEPIPKGRFVVHYAGELMTVSASELREATRIGNFYNPYIFALDYAPVEGLEENVIDANDYGNLSRFINHSCKPNMDCYVSWSHNLNPNTPTIAFFSKVDIEPGTELTFDYNADSYNRYEVKGVPDIRLEDDEFMFNGDPSLRYVPGQAADVEKASATGSSNDENEEFGRKRGRRSKKQTQIKAPAPKRSAKPPHKQHHLTSEFQQRCFCGTKKCRVFFS